MSGDGRITLEERLREGPLPPDEAVRVVWALCDRFEKGKQETLGDVAPNRVTLFGRQVEAVVPDALPVLGFSAPERTGSAPTPRSDVFAMGALLARAILGRQFDGGPLPASAAHLQAVVERCLQPDPAKRFANLSELKRALVRLDKTLMSGPKLVAEQAFTRTSLGPWTLEAVLGQGSMGTVYRAKHQALGRLAAIKVLRPEQYQNPELVQRFFQEARTVNQINHEHIVEISDFVQEPGPRGPSVVYCVMEFLHGRTLGDLMEAGPVPLARGLGAVEQVADALAAAHRVGVVHRDVKPDNIMLIERGGNRDYVKVLDFGVAKLTDTDGKAMVSTTEGAIIGTPICMSPEQAQGEEVDARSDVWAVGVILYRLLTGHFPFDAPTFVNIAVQIITKPYAPLPSRTPAGEAIPERLARLVESCLQKRRDLRPPTMDVVRDELRAVLKGDEPKRSSKAPLLAAGVVAVALVGGGIWRVTKVPDEQPPVVLPTPDVPALPPLALVEVDAGVLPEDAGLLVEDEPADAGAVVVDAPVVDAGAGTSVRVTPKVKPVTLTPEMVNKVFTRARPAITACLEKGAATIPPSGQVSIGLTIPPDGVPRGVKVTLPASSPAVEACVTKKVMQLRFPVNTGPAREGAYPFKYNLK
ncbi:MAG: protein kinase [Myxococcaceae bacterium]|nr:protein kinase [Myxococcaceae bacterium]